MSSVVQEQSLKLGTTLCKQKKFDEAEKLFRQTLDEAESTCRPDDANTLGTRYWLGSILYEQGKYIEAGEILQRAVHGHETFFGPDHLGTLDAQYWLGSTLFEQKKYDEAEKLFRQNAHRYERSLGSDHLGTLQAKYWLGITLLEQKKYDNAEEVLQRAADGNEKAFGPDNLGTLAAKNWLGITLYEQKKYTEAEEVLRQVVPKYERILGLDDPATLQTKYWLGKTLSKQKKYSEAKEVLRQVAHGQERTLGKDHEETLDTMRLLQQLPLKSSIIPTSDTAQSTLASRLNSFFSDAQDHRKSYTESDIREISTLLKHSYPQWSKVPRTYVVLRIIGYLNLLDELIDAGFSDFWFPVTKRNLPECLSPSIRTAFFDAQQTVLTKSLDLEKGEKGQHCHFKQEDILPFESKGVLGTGAYGQVDKVLSMTSFKEYARKRVLRNAAFRDPRKEYMKQFIAEIQLLKRLKHHHIVEFIGSYTDARYIGLIMSPVAEMDLRSYLEHCTIPNHPELRTFFGCLATALEFLHEQSVRHKDIKPSNILVDRGNILFADFGLSLDFTDANGSTTTSMVNGMTPRYCAPEVAQHEPRNTKSDIWSLGVVFMEMVVALKGKTVQDMDEFFREHGSKQIYIRTNLAALPAFVAELEREGKLSDNRAIGWTQQMLLAEQQLRPSASSLVSSITTPSKDEEDMGFSGICCVSPSENFSDWGDD